MNFKVVKEWSSIDLLNTDTTDLTPVKTLKKNVKEHSTDGKEMVKDQECVSELEEDQDLHQDQVDLLVQQNLTEETDQS